ncbi:hypothetical protein [Bdellovibrio bacteriovorus]|uniref:hypothetical protein n=1 Tax=Bdellovibrio bacteriovorus TaxID=959 RepID=UPI0035A74590
MRSFSLLDTDYEDTRIDTNLDKKLEYWKIQKGGLIIERYDLAEGVYYHIRKIQGARVQERVVLEENGDLYLIYAQNRRQEIYNFSENGRLCTTNHKSEWEKILKTYSQVSETDFMRTMGKSIADSCYEVDEKGTFADTLESAVRDIFRAPKDDKKNSFLSCVEGDTVKKMFVEKFGEKNGPIEHEKAVIGFKNSIIQIQEATKPIFTCKKKGSDASTPAMQTAENGLIQINMDPAETGAVISRLRQQLVHESLHRSSVKDEALTNQIGALCNAEKVRIINKDALEMRTSLANANQTRSWSMLPDKNIIKKGADDAAKENKQVIAKEDAEAPPQPAKDASPADMNRLADARGKQEAKETSTAQTSGVVRMAEKVLGSTPANAAEPGPTNSLADNRSGASVPSGSYYAGPSSAPSSSSASSESSSSSSSSSYDVATSSSSSSSDLSSRSSRSSSAPRAPASDYKMDTEVVVGSKVAAAKNLGNMRSKELQQGEYIKEEITVGGGFSGGGVANSRPSAPSDQQPQRAPAAVTPPAGARPSTPTTPSGSREVGGSGGGFNPGFSSAPGSPGNAGGGSGGSIPTVQPSVSGATPPQKSAAGTAQRNVANTTTPSRDEVVSFFSRGSYENARAKLKDQTFINTLKQNKVTVYDLGGNEYGAEKGDVIFVDQGDRFVRQK